MFGTRRKTFIHNNTLQISCFIFIGNLQDEDAFFKDYAVSHKKLSELGFKPGSAGAKVKDSTILAQSAVGVAVTAAVVILSYLYEMRKKLK